MKKLFLIPILLMLFACGSNNSLKVIEPLEYDVEIKNNAEFILIKEGTDVDEFTSNLENYLDINTNADSYTIDWLGQSLSTFTVEELKGYEGKKLEIVSGVQKTERNDKYELLDTRDLKLDEENKISKEATLNYDSFRPIKLVVDFNKNGKTERVYKTIILAVARDYEYNIIESNNITKIEDAYRKITESDYAQGYDWFSLDEKVRDNIHKESYVSNIRQSH